MIEQRAREELDRSRAWRRAYEAVTVEHDDVALPVDGALPDGLRGAFYRNGPGRMEVAGVPYDHPFDGDGHVARFHLDGRGVRYTNRWVRTREFLDEERAGRMLYRSFGTNLPGGLRRNLLRLHWKNAANTSLLWHGGLLLALWEGGQPHRLDPVTLETLGPWDYRGRLENRFSTAERLLKPDLPFSAHPKLDGATGEAWNFGTLYGRKNRLMLYRVRADGSMDAPAQHALERLAFVHDFALTPSWRIFFLAPFDFGVARALVGLESPASSLKQVPGAPTRILLVPRERGRAVEIEADPCFVFHFAGAIEERDGRLAVDAFRMARFPEVRALETFLVDGGAGYPPPLLTRYHLDPARRTVEEERLSDHPAELPVVHERAGRHRHVWAIGTTPDRDDPFFNAVLKLDTEARRERVADFTPDLPGEPLFVPRPGAADEDDGWLLTLVYRAAAHRTDLVVLDARDLSTVATARLPHHLPPGFHGLWIPS
jgi:all-trans-8'-apo-beta-carotenal 15,15'-oxygenase